MTPPRWEPSSTLPRRPSSIPCHTHTIPALHFTLTTTTTTTTTPAVPPAAPSSASDVSCLPAFLHHYTQFSHCTHSRRLTDSVSTLWPWPSASALPTIAEVLESPPHTQVTGHTRRRLEFHLVAFGTCNPALSCLVHCSQPQVSGIVGHS
jgi:hypothetical protein